MIWFDYVLLFTNSLLYWLENIVIIKFKIKMFKHKSASFHDASVESQLKIRPPKPEQISTSTTATAKRNSEFL